MSFSAFEADLLSFLLKEKKTFVKFSRKLKSQHFENEIFRWAYSRTEEYYNKFKSLPNLEVFKNELLKSSFSAKEKSAYYKTIKKIFKRKPKSSLGYISENLDEKVSREEFLVSIDKALSSLETDGVSSSKRELIRKFLLDENESSPENTGRILRDWKLRQAIRKAAKDLPLSKRFVPTPYSVINAATNGIQVSEVATVAGLTGMGKSIILGEFGVMGLLSGFNVLHYPLENTYEQTAQRYDSRLTEIKYDIIKLYDFSKPQLENFEKVFDVLSSEFKNDIEVRENFHDNMDIVSIDKDIQILKEDGFQVDFVIVDSLDIMKSVKTHKEYRLDRASIYWDFKTYCKLKRLPGLTSTQLKSTSRWKISTSEDLAEAYDKARILDIVYIMSQTEEDYKANIVRLSLDKHRDAKSGITVNLFKDSERMRFLEIVKPA